MISRCAWATVNEQMTTYHDTEWGVPLHDDAKLFEFLILDAFQAGLSWAIILRKREAFRTAFDQFNPSRIANYSQPKVADLLTNREIVRNRLKIEGTIKNAAAFLQVQDHYGSFDSYIWQFIGGIQRQNSWQSMTEIPTKTPESDAMSRDLNQRGFVFVGSTICYAFMQAAGLVNDHLVQCHRYPVIAAMQP